MNGASTFVLLAILTLLLVTAAWTDIRSRTIPNALNAAVALLAPLWWWATGVTIWPGVALQVALFGGVLGLFFILFAMGAMGGGDVKLLAALALWLPFAALADMLTVMALAGGALTLAMMIAHRARKSQAPLEIPYGVAIAFATLWVSYQRYLYQFA